MMTIRSVASGVAASCLVVLLALVVPSVTAGAQTVSSGSIGGVVRDASGGVLPGVAVEAASSVLIEKVRTVVTDDQGVYKIVDLRPGTYTVTFTLVGFSTLRREGIELTSGFTATVNGSLALGALEETVTVSGAAPLVDVQNVNQQKVFAQTVTDALPVGKNISVLATLIPGAVQSGGATAQDVGGNQGEGTQGFMVHGSRAGDFQQLREGMFFGTLVAAGNRMTSLNPATVTETVVQTSGATAENESGGALVNVVPKDGGNSFTGTFLGDFATNGLQSENLTDALRARGFTQAPSIRARYDVGVGLGGRVVRDKLWFFASSRYWTTSDYQPGNYYNNTQGTLFYTPDLDRPAYSEDYYREVGVRLTWQVSQKNKVSGSYLRERNCNCMTNIGSGTRAPEATGGALYSPNWKTFVTWSYPATNRLLLEAGAVVVDGIRSRILMGGAVDDPAVLDASRNYGYGNPYFVITSSLGRHHFGQTNQKFSVSYVTGSHAFKSGVQVLHGWKAQDFDFPASLFYTFSGTAPLSVTYFAAPVGDRERMRTIGAFAQDQWTIRRLTISAGVRFDGLNGWVPEQHLPAGPFVPARDFAALKDVPDWKDVNPRLGGSFDLFGNGKTAVKGFLGRYVVFESINGIVSLSNHANTIVTTATRTWNDANGDYLPQEGELGPLSSNTFGQVVRTTFFADDVLHGFGTRPSNWQTSLQVQHELRPGIALNVGYFRTWYGGFTVTDNRAVVPSDFSRYCIMVPASSGLPAEGQQICDFYDIDPAKFGQTDNLVTLASHYGDQSEVFNGVDVTLGARFGGGGVIQGGVSTGRTVTDRCFVVDSPQERYQCRNSPPWSAGTQLKLSFVYPLPWDIDVSANFQDVAGIPTTASYVARNAEIVPSLGRNLGSCGVRPTCNGTATVELVPANALYEEPRIRQLDLRLRKTLSLSGIRVEPRVDFFNLINASPILQMNTRYGPSWRNATEVLSPRVVKLGVQMQF